VAAPYKASPHYRLVDAGVVCILFLAGDMSVRKAKVLSLETMGAAETAEVVRLQQHSSRFGCAVSALGDINADGVNDLAVSVCGADEEAGAILVLNLKRDGAVGAVAAVVSINSIGAGNLTSIAANLDLLGPASPALEKRAGAKHLGFGSALCAFGDLDDDGFTELAVTALAPRALVIVRLTQDGAIKSVEPVTDASGRALLQVPPHAVTGAGDVDADGMPDILLGGDGQVSMLTGLGLAAAPLLRELAVTGDEMFEGLGGDVLSGSYFGKALAAVADVNGDSALDLANGAFGQELLSGGRGSFKGELYVANLRSKTGVSVKV
jgi:hypothetical protein